MIINLTDQRIVMLDRSEEYLLVNGRKTLSGPANITHLFNPIDPESPQRGVQDHTEDLTVGDKSLLIQYESNPQLPPATIGTFYLADKLTAYQAKTQGRYDFLYPGEEVYDNDKVVGYLSLYRLN